MKSNLIDDLRAALAGRSQDIIDVIELLKLGKVCIDDVSRRLSSEERKQFQDLVAIANLEKEGKPKEGRRILLAMLATSAGRVSSNRHP